MNAALKYCHNKFQKTLTTVKTKEIHHSFELLAIEIQKLDTLSQIHLYSATSQFLEQLIKEPQDLVNPLDVFTLRCSSLIDHKYNINQKLIFGLAIVAISLAVLIVSCAAGIGIGVLAGLWATPMLFLNALFSAHLAAITVSAVSSALSIGSAAVSSYFFFKKPQIKTVLSDCINSIKETQLAKDIKQESYEEKPLEIQKEINTSIEVDQVNSPK